MRVYYTLAVWQFKLFLSVGFYRAVYGPEIIGAFGLEDKKRETKVVCSLGRTNYGGLRNVQPPIIDPL